jgi:hypothetical protein
VERTDIRVGNECAAGGLEDLGNQAAAIAEEPFSDKDLVGRAGERDFDFDLRIDRASG